MSTSITIRFDESLARELRREARRSGQSASQIVRDSVRRQLAVRRFEELRARMVPQAEALGYLTDEDVFRDIS